MKLVDILARELKVWPEGFAYLEQGSDGRLFSTLKGRVVSPDHVELADDWLNSIITREQWQAAVDALNEPKPVEWCGKGLPPVGTLVNVSRGDCTWFEGDEWQIGKTATVMASFNNSLSLGMVAIQFESGHCECILARCLSPVLTPEQIEAEKRESGIDEIYAILDNNDRSLREDAAFLWDAGYRKQVAP